MSGCVCECVCVSVFLRLPKLPVGPQPSSGESTLEPRTTRIAYGPGPESIGPEISKYQLHLAAGGWQQAAGSRNNNGSSCGCGKGRGRGRAKFWARPKLKRKVKSYLGRKSRGAPTLTPTPTPFPNSNCTPEWLNSFGSKMQIITTDFSFYFWSFLLHSARFLLIFRKRLKIIYLPAGTVAHRPGTHAHTHTQPASPTHRYFPHGHFSGLLPFASFCITLAGHHFHRQQRRRCGRGRGRQQPNGVGSCNFDFRISIRLWFAFAPINIKISGGGAAAS